MSVTNDFDKAASNYDLGFTHTQVGKLQRLLVHKYLSEKILNTKQPLDILELNCGTGEDAIWLAKKGHQVLATDISKRMIAIGSSKDSLNSVTFEQLDIKKIEKRKFDKKFDLIFSNFGGLNCLSPIELNIFFKYAGTLLVSGGKIVIVVMSKQCLWDNLYLFLKGNWKSLYRRNTSNDLEVNVEGVKVNTWYYNPNDIINCAYKQFLIDAIVPVGFFLPPSYLNDFFKTRISFLSFLNKLEQRAKNRPLLARYSDHYIITLKNK